MQNTLQKFATLLIVIGHISTRLNARNLIRIRMNEIETQIKGNLGESEVDVNGQARRASCWEAKAWLPCDKSEFLVVPVHPLMEKIEL